MVTGSRETRVANTTQQGCSLSEYALGYSADEARRLARQADYLAPHTRRMLQAAGVRPNTRVLDLGTGGGDVALLAAELGATVVTVERDPTTIERTRPRLAGKPITPVQGDLHALTGVDGTFDVICGRLILMYLKDPGAIVRDLAARYLQPGGAVGFLEYDFTPARLYPRPAIVRDTIETFSKVLEGVGAATDLGLRLPQLLDAAGFEVSTFDTALWSGVRPDAVAPEMLAWSMRSVMPYAQKLGLAERVGDIETLHDRLRGGIRTEGTTIGPVIASVVARPR